MEIIQEFYEDKDEEKFLKRCDESGLEHKVIQTTEIKIVYQIGGRRPIALVTYYPSIKEVGILWFTCNLVL